MATKAGKAIAQAIRESIATVPVKDPGGKWDGTNGWTGFNEQLGKSHFDLYQAAIMEAMGEAIVDFMRQNLVIYGYAPVTPYSSAPATLKMNLPSTAVTPLEGGNTGVSFSQDFAAPEPEE